MNLHLHLLSGKDVGETVMYFGCRHKAEDFLYQEELEAFEKAGALTQLNVAFSRDQEHKVQQLFPPHLSQHGRKET